MQQFSKACSNSNAYLHAEGKIYDVQCHDSLQALCAAIDGRLGQAERSGYVRGQGDDGQDCGNGYA